MLDALILSLLATAPGAVPAPLAASPAPAVQDDEKPDKREEVKALVEKLKGHVKERGKEDGDAIAVVDQLKLEFDQSGLKDRATIAKAIGDCLKVKRTEVDGQPDNKLYLACAVVLGEMGPESVKPLAGWIDHKQHRKDLILQGELIRSLGKTKDEKAVDTLSDLLKHKDPSSQAAAAEALGNFAHLKSDARKEIFEDILKEITQVKNRKDGNLEDLEARERYDVIKSSMITTMQVLSGHDERDPSEWRSWWNDNKKRDWDDEG